MPAAAPTGSEAGQDIAEMMRLASVRRHEKKMRIMAAEVELSQWGVDDLQEALNSVKDEEITQLIITMIDKKKAAGALVTSTPLLPMGPLPSVGRSSSYSSYKREPSPSHSSYYF